jgi:nicotinate phosphoribosyltransferase
VDEEGVERPRVKLAGEKTTWPGRKEVYRHPAWDEDVVQLATEPAPAGYARLLRPVMRAGRVVPGSLPPLSEVWELAQANLRALPERYRALSGAPAYPVRFSAALLALREEAARASRANGAAGATESGAAGLAASAGQRQTAQPAKREKRDER